MTCLLLVSFEIAATLKCTISTQREAKEIWSSSSWTRFWWRRAWSPTVSRFCASSFLFDKDLDFFYILRRHVGDLIVDCLFIRTCAAGTKALNKTSVRTFPNDSRSEDVVVFVTVFTTYNSTVDRRVNGRPVDLVTIGDTSYNKIERSMAILDVFINFIQVYPSNTFKELELKDKLFRICLLIQLKCRLL